MNLKTLRASKVSLLQQVMRLAPNAHTVQEALATTDVAKFLLGTSTALFTEGMESVQTSWDAIFASVPSSTRHEPTRQNTHGATLPQVPEGGEIPFGKIMKPTIGFITNHKYAELFAITEEMITYNEVQKIADNMRELGERAAMTIEATAMAVLADVNSFNANLRGTTALSRSAVQEAIVALMTQTDDSGHKLNIVPDTLYVPASLQFTAKEIIDSDILIGVPASNVLTGNSNGLKGFLRVVVGPQLTDQNDWFVGKAKKGLRTQIVTAPYMKDVTPLTANPETVPTVEERIQKTGVTFGCGVADDRYWFKSTVSA